MDKKASITGREPLATWAKPRLAFVGRVADVLQSGGGKLSVTAADPGEMRCEKPHLDQCS